MLPVHLIIHQPQTNAHSALNNCEGSSPYFYFVSTEAKTHTDIDVITSSTRTYMLGGLYCTSHALDLNNGQRVFEVKPGGNCV